MAEVNSPENESNKMSTLLPLSRIRTIMKQCPDTKAIAHEGLFLIAR